MIEYTIYRETNGLWYYNSAKEVSPWVVMKVGPFLTRRGLLRHIRCVRAAEARKRRTTERVVL